MIGQWLALVIGDRSTFGSVGRRPDLVIGDWSTLAVVIGDWSTFGGGDR